MESFAVEVKGVWKKYRAARSEVAALSNIEIFVREGSFFVLLGPSGSGKSTALRCIAGLERPDRGLIAIGGVLVSIPEKGFFLPPEKRRVGMVFQSYAVWPHMSVYDNVAFPLRRGYQRLNKRQTQDRVERSLSLVKMQGLEDRSVHELSGGQQQRVALARALALQPKVLLMDEPLSNLDAKLRDEMRGELKNLTRSLGITTLHVTHDQVEALSLGTEVAVMNNGEILQVGPPEEIYKAPNSLFVAGFIGEMNLFSGVVGSTGRGEAGRVTTRLGPIRCHLPPDVREGDSVEVGIRPEEVELDPTGSQGANNAFPGRVHGANFLGDFAVLEIEACGQVVRAKGKPDLARFAGAPVTVHLPAEKCHIFHAGSRKGSSHL